MTLRIRPNAIEQDFGPFTFPGVRLPNDGLHILDTDASHHLVIKPGSNLSADRVLTITTGDAARTITLSGDPTLGDWFDQAVKVASTPTFADVFVPDGGTFGISGNELLTFNAAGYATFSGCNVGIGTAAPNRLLHISGIPNPGFIFSNTTPGRSMGFFAGTTSSVIEYDSAGSLLIRYNSKANIDAGLLVGSTNVMVFTASGDVGIGTPTPSARLDIEGVGATLLQLNRVGGTANAGMQFTDDEGSIYIGLDANEGFSVSTAANLGGAGNLLTVRADGNVGIGLVAPVGKLHVDQTSSTGAIPVLFLDQGDVSEQCIQFSSDAVDRDINLFTVNVTGTPKMWWDESEDQFALTKGLIIDAGDLEFTTDGSGLIFGEIYANDVADEIAITIAGQANKVQITSFAIDGLANNMTVSSANDDITVLVAGMYFCSVSVTLSSAGGGGADDVGFAVYKNNGTSEFTNLHGHRKLAGGGGDRGSATMSGIVDLAVNDTIEVWIWNEDSTDNIVVDDITLSLAMIGGT